MWEASQIVGRRWWTDELRAEWGRQAARSTVRKEVKVDEQADRLQSGGTKLDG